LKEKLSFFRLFIKKAILLYLLLLTYIMPRIARIVIPKCPHHIIQRGNRRQQVFFTPEDKQLYLNCLNDYAKPAGISIWGYCLMDNHVHLIVVPKTKNSLSKGLGDAHRKYTYTINSRQNWRGYLWEGRFKSYPLSEEYLFAAMRYIERNPVRATMVKKAENYKWSSAYSHVYKKHNHLLDDNFLLSGINDWSLYLLSKDKNNDIHNFRKHFRNGRPLGNNAFISNLEEITGRKLRRDKPGPKKINNS